MMSDDNSSYENYRKAKKKAVVEYLIPGTYRLRVQIRKRTTEGVILY